MLRRLIFITVLFRITIVFSQDNNSTILNNSLQIDTAITDSIFDINSIVSDTLTQDSLQQEEKEHDIQTTIKYQARDSLFFDVKKRIFFLYGNTHIDYGNISLDAERTNVNWYTKIVKSTYIVDSTNRKIGRPVFKDESDVYQTNNIIYNFQSKKAIIKGVVTEQEGGFMHGENVKKNAQNEMFIKGAKYTTCNLEDPHFFIESTRLKAIPNNKVVSGPFNLKFRDLPTPLFFPFGMFPQPRKKSSGIIFPSYGEEKRRGFFLRNGGYYFAVSDHVDLRVTGDIYSKGGYGLQVTSNYIKRYAYRGTLNYSNNRIVSDNIENPLANNLSNDFRISWNHSPQSRRNSSFSSSVSFATATYIQNTNLVNQDFNRSINPRFNSNISFRTKLPGTPFSLSASLRHSQNIQTRIVNLTIPDLTLNMNRIYPFKKIIKSNQSPLAKLSFSHNFVARNELSNAPVSSFPFNTVNGNNKRDTLAFNFENLPEIFKRSKLGGRHSIPISTSLSVLKYFTLSPSLSYQEVWYPRELDFTYIESENAVQVDTIEKFSRAGSWSSGVSLNTRFYGTKIFGKGKIQAIRHVLTPSISFSYRPDFSDTKYGVYKNVQIDEKGNTRLVSKYQGFTHGSPSRSESKSIGLSLSNNLEMKVSDKKDTVRGYKKIKLFDNFGMSSGYNVAADSFRLSSINLNARTSFFNNNISVNVSGSVDPYEYLLISEDLNRDGSRRVRQRRLDRYTWNNGNGLGRLSRINTAISINLSPKSFENKSNSDKTTPEDNKRGGLPVNFEGYTEEEQQEIEILRDNPELYVDFSIPWSLNISYSINRNKTGFNDPNVTQSLSFNGSLGLTKKTKITFRSGYDFETKEFTTTRINMSRDLHCWTMNFDWVPFGRYQSYFFTIKVKASLLQDLKIEKRRNFLDFFN